MKICILGDTHFGARSDLPIFHDFFAKFYEYMFDTLEAQGVDTIIQLGDLWDRRKYINFNTLSRAKKYFFDQIDTRKINMVTLVGNHDIPLKEFTTYNSSDMLLREYNTIQVCNIPQTFCFDGMYIDVIPWISKENESEVMQFIKRSKSEVCVGHFEIDTFRMYATVEAQGGLPIKMFSHYKSVLSGHFHTKSSKGNITYVGTPYEMTWQDYNDPRGFHLLDTTTGDLEFFENPFHIFTRIEYDDVAGVIPLEPLNLKDHFVKLIVANKTDLYKFDQYLQKLYDKGCYEVKIYEDVSEFKEGELTDEEINLEDTMDILSQYIDSIETSSDKDNIKQYMKSLYIEAISQGSIE